MNVHEALAAKRAEREQEKPEPKWGRERRARITVAMVDPNKRHQRHEVITFTRKVMRAVDLRHFFNHIATEHDIIHVEKLLGLSPYHPISQEDPRA
jgi:hypothetical protein